MPNTLREAQAPSAAILTDKNGVVGAEVVSSAPSAGQTGLVVYTIPSATVLQTQDGADGTVGSAAPAIAIQVGARDAGNLLQPLNIDASGNLKVVSTGGAAGVQFADNAASGATPTGTLAEGWDSANSKIRALKVDANQNLQVNVNAALPAGSAVIGHVIADTGSTTAVTGNVTVVQPTAANLNATVKVTDGTNLATVKAASTAAVATDTALVVSLSPNNPITVAPSSIAAGTAVIGKVGMAGRSLDDADGRVVIGSEGLPLSQFQGTEFNELAVQDVNLARVLGSSDLTVNGRLKVDSTSTDQVFSGFISAQKTTFGFPCSGSTTTTFQIGGTWTGTVTFEGAAGGSATTGADPLVVLQVSNIAAAGGSASTATVNGVYRVSTIGMSRVQVRFSTATSGSPSIVATVSNGLVYVDTLIRGGTVTQVAASRTVGNVGAALDAVINTGAAPANALWTESAPATAAAAALSVSAQSALTVVNVKATAGNVYGCSVQNPNASTIFIQFYNTAGTPTLGTSVIWWLPVGASATVFFGGSPFALANFATGIGVGAATTATGAGAPASAPAVVVHYL